MSKTPTLSLPWKVKLQFSLFDFISDYALQPDGSIIRFLANLLDRRAPPSTNSISSLTTRDVTIDSSSELWFRLFVPTDTSSDVRSIPVVVFFHGGGFVLMSAAATNYHTFCREVALRCNVVVVSVNYRLAPEHKFPSQYDDGFEVLKFIDKNHDNMSIWQKKADFNRCFLVGDSAGGNIAHHLAVRVCQAEQKFQHVNIIGLILIQPFFGGLERVGSETRLEGTPIVSVSRTDKFWKAFLSKGQDRDHWAVNVDGPNGVDLSGLDLPRVVLFVGGFDALRDWQLRYYQWLQKSGKEVVLVDIPTACHGFYGFLELPETDALLIEVKDFIVKQCASST